VNTIFKSFLSLLVLAVMLIPLWFFIGARSILSPEGFFQEFFVLGVGVWILGAAQLGFLVVGILMFVAVWEN
jgi:hypothetical protein